MKFKIENNIVRKYLWIVLFITNILAIILLLASTQAWNFLPSKAPAIAFLGMAFPVLFVINILYLIFWLFTLKWAYIGVQLVVLMLCWSPLHTYMPVSSPSDYIPEESFKVLSYNVRHFNWTVGKAARENPIFDYILEQNPDVICMQEFGAAKKKTAQGLISKGEIDQKFKDYPYKELVILGNPNAPSLYGLAIYSKFPIQRTGKLPIYSTYNGCAVHELIIKGKKVTLFNTHLESNRITSDDKKLYADFLKSDKDIKLKDVTSNIKSKLSLAFSVREDQTHIIRSHVDKVSKDSHATIICGDFNDTPISYTYQSMKGDLIDSFVSTGRGLGITYHENMFLFRIDYIFHSIRLQAYNATVGDQKYSDHYPIWTNLMFK